MDKDYITELISSKLRLIRTESRYTQEKMANVLGISKKTLVQIEKGRSTAVGRMLWLCVRYFRTVRYCSLCSVMSLWRLLRLWPAGALTGRKGRRSAAGFGREKFKEKRNFVCSKICFLTITGF